MTKIYDFPQKDKRLDDASEWIAKLERGLSADEAQALQAWMGEHPDNAGAVLELAELWDQMDTLSRLGDLFEEPLQRRTAVWWSLSAAAAFAIVAVAGWFSYATYIAPADPTETPAPRAAAEPLAYETAVGEQSTVNLPDGTQVVLNTNTSIKVRYTQRHRVVRLERGEVQFRVAEDSSRPFSAVVGETVIQAVGTVFNIEMSNDQRVELVVTEGKVLVGVHRGSFDTEVDEPPVVLPMSSLTVKAGEEVILGTQEDVVTEVSAAEIEVRLSWQAGNLVFRGEALEDAVAEIGRYTSIEFVFLDEELRQVRIVGLFKAGDVDGLLAALRENFDIAYRRTDDQILLLSNNR